MKKILIAIMFVGIFGGEALATSIQTMKTFTLLRHRTVNESHDWDSDNHSLTCVGMGSNRCQWAMNPIPSSTAIDSYVTEQVNSGNYNGSAEIEGFNVSWTYDSYSDMLTYTAVK